MDRIVEVDDVSRRFGAAWAVRDCSISVERGSITGLIGPNGAGKSTLFNIVAGALAPTRGRVRFDGQDVTNLPPHRRCERGMLRTFQIAHEFSRMTVLENLMAAPGGQAGEALWRNWLTPGRVAREEAAIRIRANDVARFLGLGGVVDELAGNVSGGQKKLVELGRTMMVDASAVLLDEIAAGVNKSLLAGLAENIRRMNRELGYTFFLIEHDMDFVAKLCDPVIVMASGSVLALGTIADLRRDERVVDAYFGGAPQS